MIWISIGTFINSIVYSLRFFPLRVSMIYSFMNFSNNTLNIYRNVHQIHCIFLQLLSIETFASTSTNNWKYWHFIETFINSIVYCLRFFPLRVSMIYSFMNFSNNTLNIYRNVHQLHCTDTLSKRSSTPLYIP